MIEIIRFEYIFSDLAKELECIIFNGKFYDFNSERLHSLLINELLTLNMKLEGVN